MPTFPLADEFFLINHDHLSGKPELHRSLLGCGLVVGLLAELIMQERAALREGRVTAVQQDQQGDEATDFVATSVGMQPSPHTVRTWIDNLDDTAYELVARRLVERGVVRRTRPRQLLRARREQFPTIKREGVQPRLSLDEVIEHPEQADVQQAMLAAMVATTGAEHIRASGPDRDSAQEAVARLAATLPADLAELLAGFDEAITARLLSIRR